MFPQQRAVLQPNAAAARVLGMRERDVRHKVATCEISWVGAGFLLGMARPTDCQEVSHL